MKKQATLLQIVALLLLLAAPASANEGVIQTSSSAGECYASGQGEITPLSSLTIHFNCSTAATVYFGVCDSGSAPDDDLFNIVYAGSVVSNNEIAGGAERTNVGQANVLAGAQQATLHSLNNSPHQPATYSYALSSSRSQVAGYLNAWCGFDPQAGGGGGGSIRGLVFNDANRNKVRDSGEQALAGVNVTLSSGDWRHTFVSGDDGTYAPVGLGSGYYSAEVTPPLGYIITGQHRYDYIEVGGAAGWVILGIDFALAPSIAPGNDQPPPAQPPCIMHVVQPGEWLFKIARIYGVSVWSLIEANDLPPSLQLTPGQTLIISCPAPAQGCRAAYVVQPGDNLFRIALRHHVSMFALAARNGIKFPYPVYAGQVLCIP